MYFTFLTEENGFSDNSCITSLRVEVEGLRNQKIAERSALRIGMKTDRGNTVLFHLDKFPCL